MKLLKVLFVAAIAIAIAAPSFAAVQNIKVSGSVEEQAIYMNNFDLRHKTEENTASRFSNNLPWATFGSGQSINEDSGSFVLSTIKVGVDSDLTDNVSASVVLSNQSRWGQDSAQDLSGTGINVARGNFSGISVNKAYVTLKEFFYQPLTLKIGRQDMMFGSGFIIGPGIYRDPTGAFARPRADVMLNRFNGAAQALVLSGPLGLQYSDSTYYDAIRATLDLEPWTIDAVYSKIESNAIDLLTNSDDDQNLYGVNVAYKFDTYDAKAEGYYWYKDNENFNSDLGYIDPGDYAAGTGLGVDARGNANGDDMYLDTTVPGVGARRYEANRVSVIGLRGDITPVENLTLSGEGAFQWGKLIDERGFFNASTDGSSLRRNRRAWAVDVEGNYLWTDVSYKPNLGLGYVYLSGNKTENTGRFGGWDAMFKGKNFSLIRDFQRGTGTAWDAVGGNIYQTLDYRAPSGNTNSHTFWVDGGLKPMDDLSLKARYLNFWADKKAVGRSGKHIGQEVDASLVYDYTEDVQFDVTGGIFFPGKLFKNNPDTYTLGRDTATIVTGSVKVVF